MPPSKAPPNLTIKVLPIPPSPITITPAELSATETLFDRDEWKHHAPYRLHIAGFADALVGQCHCGLVQFQLRGEPRSVHICHCRRCQLLHGAPFAWVAEFGKEDINFVYGPRHLKWYDAETRATWHRIPCLVRCTHCHTPVMDERADSVLVFPPLLRFRSVDEADKFQPNRHTFYSERSLNVEDGLPKWAGEKEVSKRLSEADGQES